MNTTEKTVDEIIAERDACRKKIDADYQKLRAGKLALAESTGPNKPTGEELKKQLDALDKAMDGLMEADAQLAHVTAEKLSDKKLTAALLTSLSDASKRLKEKNAELKKIVAGFTVAADVIDTLDMFLVFLK
jgi:chromosome segregation ATPase